MGQEHIAPLQKQPFVVTVVLALQGPPKKAIVSHVEGQVALQPVFPAHAFIVQLNDFLAILFEKALEETLRVDDQIDWRAA